MESMELENLFSKIYKGRSVLITGITGFKGSWLAQWLHLMGAKVSGYSMPPPTTPNHYDIINLDIPVVINDIRKYENVQDAIDAFKPEIVFHLAAQSLVRYSYKNPLETFETNVIGTLNLFEACRKNGNVKAIVNVTSDKCYDNREWLWGYREIDPMGGFDPYSASKGCSELLTGSYRNSYFNLDSYKKTHTTLLASCRAGNVIGGGDWAEDRLIPDIVKSTVEKKEVIIRSPKAVRPWQHVLEPLSGYLLLGQKLLEEKIECADAWNFGPSDEGNVEVGHVVNDMQAAWPRIQYTIQQKKEQLHEASLLKLDCSKARTKLRWKPVWDTSKAVAMTARWYKMFYDEKKIMTTTDLALYLKDAREKNTEWSVS